MKLSVIIVNYNVKFFIEQCLYSVIESAKHCETEIYVVDNNSVDGSCSMIKSKFPSVNLIENKVNYGFSFANNQAIKQSTGDYVLLLNPDTVIEEKTLKTICDFMDTHQEAGGIGVKMIDGKGRFLPESKRGLPTPKVAFYKIFGLSKLFPKSKKFGQYHLSYLDKNSIHEVDVLSGACMLLRRETLNKIGLLDETFFMYGEDIDLSYRITLGAYKNYYLPTTTIIHYKGESTKKSSINYVIVFYNAMLIFAKKHFSKKNAGLLIFFIKIAIYLRASLSIIKRIVNTLICPIIDIVVIATGFLIITPQWSKLQFGHADAYPQTVFIYAISLYLIIWILSFIFSGAYDKPLKIKNLYKGIIVGTALILVAYSLFPENIRFSRAIILLGATWTCILLPLIRILLHYTTNFEVFRINNPNKKRIAIIGTKEENMELRSLFNSNNKIIISANVSPFNNEDDTFFSGTINQLDEIININKIDEIIFCAKNLKAQQIIQTMLKLNNTRLDYKIASQDGFSVIGSNSINSTGELYTININSISKPENKRLKRVVDLFFSFIMLLLFPILIFFIKKPLKAIKNLLSILFGIKTFVAYYNADGIDVTMLPKLKKAYFSPIAKDKINIVNLDAINRLNIMYAKDYNILTDINIILKSWRNIGTC